MKPIESTAEILLLRMLGRTPARKYIDWAYEMMVAGFESENLLLLAAETEPCNPFELESLVDKVLADFNLDWKHKERVLKNYACYLVNEALRGKIMPNIVLSIIKDIYLELEHESVLQDFYLLYWAKDDLKYSDKQWYWNDASRENIDNIIMDYFRKWRNECKQGQI